MDDDAAAADAEYWADAQAWKPLPLHRLKNLEEVQKMLKDQKDNGSDAQKEMDIDWEPKRAFYCKLLASEIAALGGNEEDDATATSSAEIAACATKNELSPMDISESSGGPASTAERELAIVKPGSGAAVETSLDQTVTTMSVNGAEGDAAAAVARFVAAVNNEDCSELIREMEALPEDEKVEMAKAALKFITDKGIVSILGFCLEAGLRQESKVYIMRYIIAAKIKILSIVPREISDAILELVASHEDLVITHLVDNLLQTRSRHDIQTEFLLSIFSRITNKSLALQLLLSSVRRHSWSLDADTLSYVAALTDPLSLSSRACQRDVAALLLRAAAAQDMRKSAKFGKSVLAIVKQLPPAIDAEAERMLQEIIHSHQSFLKKAIDNEVKKKKVIQH